MREALGSLDYKESVSRHLVSSRHGDTPTRCYSQATMKLRHDFTAFSLFYMTFLTKIFFSESFRSRVAEYMTAYATLTLIL